MITTFRKGIVFGAVAAIVLFIQCSSANHENSDDEIAKGKALAAQYCQSCHLLPSPDLLTKDKWQNGVLPVMALYLGMNNNANAAAQNMDSIERSVLPQNPVLDTAEWRLINEYYVATAPENFPTRPQAVPDAITQFSVQLPPADFFGTVSVTSYARIDTTTKSAYLLVGNAITNEVQVLNPQLTLIQTSKTDGAVVDMSFDKEGTLACIIGKEIIPSNKKEGKISYIHFSGNGAVGKVLFDSLARPVQFTKADLNRDGRADYIICEFGNLVGQLSWMESSTNGQYTKHILRSKPGALRTYVQDYNKDGLPDIWAQFAQADECIVLYTNKGSGQFEERPVLRFPPLYGSTYFELADFNKDGFEDILYTCGDNADYSQELKPYHGIYLFINDGKNHFQQQYFYRVNGCYKALARDFDGDGDLDIAAVSFFPAAATPWEAFTYLENKGGFTFQPFSLPQSIPFQKSVTMDVGDIDADGKPDLLLGSGYFTSKPDGAKQPLFITLTNKGRKQ